MSRMGKLPVVFDSKVKADYKNRLLKVKGKLGEMTFKVPASIELAVDKESIRVEADVATREGRTMSGTARSIISNMVHGVTKGFTKNLELVGVGYRAQLKGQNLILALGYSHPIEYQLPKVVKAEVEANTKITLTSCDKQVLGQTAAEIRRFRPPEPYKGKGILRDGEYIKRKAGKAAKASA
ncbi:MAG: 50S ribosomal protein L6 [Proteobacteria bacterium]|nr:50S ribosomal protein L6 [Pseudomonadota bacterium]